MENLFERCGMAGLAIFSKGHVQDRSIPWILESAAAGDFLRESLNIEPMDLLAKFEQWCCAREKGTWPVDVSNDHRLIIDDRCDWVGHSAVHAEAGDQNDKGWLKYVWNGVNFYERIY